MATEALKRLREGIEAAFEAQRRLTNDRSLVVTSPKTLTSKWGEVTALLASVDRPAGKKSTLDATKRVSRSLQPAKVEFKDAKLQQSMVSEKQMLLRRRFMDEWQRIAHAAAVVTRLHIRAQRRREERLAEIVFNAWRQRILYRLKLKTLANFVKQQTKFTDMAVMWRRWKSARCRAVKLREFCMKRRERLSCEAFCTWVLAASQRARFRKYRQKAARQLLRSYWRWLKAAIETQRMINFEIKYFIERRIVELNQRWFNLWIEFVEQQKRWRFAVRWSERKILGDAFDHWMEVHEDTRRVRHALQLATRRRRRRKLRQVFGVWNIHVQHVVKRKRVLTVVFHSQQRRKAFANLVLNARYDHERKRSLQNWKIRRAVWNWHHHSHRDRILRLRSEFLKESHDRLMLRSFVWRPWRRIYLRSVTARMFTAKQRVEKLRGCWIAFVLAVSHQEHQRLLVESLADTREVRELRRTIGVWRVQTTSSRKLKKLRAKCVAFYQRGLLRQAIRRWKAAHQVTQREKSLSSKAVNHLTRKMIQHWAKWAYWSRRELGRRISVVKEQKQQRQMRQCITNWRRMVHTRQRAVCNKFFNAWKVGIDMQHRQCHFVELRRLIQLRWRWKCWELFAVRCQDLRAKAHETQKLCERRLMRHSLVIEWLAKTRRYKLGSNVLTVLVHRHVLQCALSRWRRNKQRLSAVRLASEFHRKKLQKHYLRLLFKLTIGHKRTAIAYNRRRHLVCAWSSWNQYFMLIRRRYEAEVYFRRRAKQNAVHLLHVAAVNSITSRNQRLDAEAWHEVVVLQRILSGWFAAAQHSRRCKFIGQQLAWDIVGRRVFRTWQNSCVERQNLLKAAQFHSSVVVTRSWNALLRVTKRRQVALAMWTHSMARVRLAHVFTNWNQFMDNRRGQYAVAASMCRMQELRIRQRLFAAWTRLITARRSALCYKQRESLRWRQTCWNHWKVWRVSRRWQRSQQLILLRKTFSHGLKCYAIQQQALREICVQTARNLLHRSLAQWRVEWWLVRNQKMLILGAKRNALMHWKTFVAACRQKRRWERYVQQLHRTQTRSKATVLDNQRRTGGTFRDTRALQAQLKRHRILMTHVLHAWYLVVQNRRRRNCSLALSSSKKLRRRQAAELHRSSSKARQRALEFWAHRVMEKYFFTWREQSNWQRAEFAPAV